MEKLNIRNLRRVSWLGRKYELKAVCLKLCLLMPLPVSFLEGCASEPHIANTHVRLKEPSQEKITTDQSLIEYEARRTPLKKEQKREYVGLHHGALVFADFFCGDVCPDNNVRVIHYQLNKNQQCNDVSGREDIVSLPGVFYRYQKFCVPNILKRHMY